MEVLAVWYNERDMLTKRIIPCLDVSQGRVIKGVKFLDHRDAGDPVELAAYYDSEGADEMVFYDITASAQGRGIMLDVVSRTAEKLFIPLTVGGGLRSVEDMSAMLNAGADKVSVQHGGGGRPRPHPPRRGCVRQPVHSAWHGREAGRGRIRAAVAGAHTHGQGRRPPPRPGRHRVGGCAPRSLAQARLW